MPVGQDHYPFENAEGMVQIVRQVVKQYRSQPAPENNTDGAVKNQIGHLVRTPDLIQLCGSSAQQPPGQHDARDITDAIPADLDEAQIDGHGVEIRVAQHILLILTLSVWLSGESLLYQNDVICLFSTYYQINQYYLTLFLNHRDHGGHGDR